MVSRYWVDGVVIAGLVGGALGVTYLSMGLFGKHGVRFLRPLLAACFFATGAAIYFHANPTRDIPWPLIAIGAFVGGYLLTLSVSLLADLRGEAAVSKVSLQTVVWSVITIGVGILTILAVQVLSLLKLIAPSGVLTAIVNLSIFLCFAGATYFNISVWVVFFASLSEAKLRVYGLILTFVGIATQFLPPVLDLLNISVK
jgi:hypothetical protein